MRYFCTLSDKNFLAKGLALYMSLKKHCSEEFRFYYLCLDKESYDKLSELGESFSELRPAFLGDLESAYPELSSAKANRPYNEYCWTLASFYTNCLINMPHEMAFGSEPLQSITYVDSDLYFYSDPKIIFDEIGNRSIGIIAHRHNGVGDQDGAYNVGLIYFKNDKIGKECLYWWMDAVLTKKYPHLQTCGDQKYLEEFIPRFGAENVCVADQTFAHGAPWNFRLYRYDRMKEGNIVWGEKTQPLVFNHFSRFSYDMTQNSMSFTTGQYRDHTLNFQVFGIPEVFNFYREYFEELKGIHMTLLSPRAPAVRTRKVKIAFGTIVLNGDYVLKQCLESAYPFAHQMLIAEGPVTYWQEQGLSTSNDKTNEILHSFPDPDRKLSIIHGQFLEKDDQCRAYMQFMKDADYIFNLDSDEIYKPEDIETIIKLLYDEKYTSVGIKSCSFYGGFDRYIGGFEEEKDQFLRIFKVYPGSTWYGHRPPRIIHDPNVKNMLAPRHLDSDTLYEKFGVRMYHYSAVFPRQVYTKQMYYKSLARDKFIGNYFENVYLPWVTGTDQDRERIENIYQGVHEYKPKYRRPTLTKPFEGAHPLVIQNSLQDLKNEFNKQLGLYGKHS